MAEQESDWKEWLGVTNNIWGAVAMITLIIGWLFRIPFPFSLFLYGGAFVCVVFCVTGMVYNSRRRSFVDLGRLSLGMLPPDQRPNLEVTILEVDIRPLSERTGWCFLHIKLHNNTDVVCEIPKEYSLILTVKSKPKPYTITRFLDLSKFYLSIYNDIVSYDDDGNAYPDEVEVDREDPLNDLRHDTRMLERGKPLYGWLGFDLYANTIPSWEYEDEYRGQYLKPMFSDEGDFIEETLVDETERIYLVRGIQKVTLRAMDAWNRPCVGHRDAPFFQENRKVLQRETSD